MDGAPDTEFLAAEIERPFDIPTLVKAIGSPAVAADVYAASLMAIELDTVEEADYLRRITAGLGLDDEAVSELHDRFGAPPLTMAEVPVAETYGWFFASGRERIGPIHGEISARHARSNPDAQCWRDGFDDWQPVSTISEFAEHFTRSFEHVAGSAADDMQFVEVELDPGESAIAEAGALMYKHNDISLMTIFGDGSGQQDRVFDKLLGAGKRVLTPESLFLTVFTTSGEETRQVAFAAPFPGSIIPVKLSEVGGMLICQKDSFMAAAKGVEIGIHFQKRILTGFFGGEGFIMQSLTASVDYRIAPIGGVKTMMFGGEGIFVAKLTGPGKIWLQSLPFSRLAGHIHATMPSRSGSGGGDLLGTVSKLIK